MAESFMETSSPIDLLSALDASVPRDTWRRALAALGGLRGLALAPLSILELYGVPARAAAAVHAALELARRVQALPDERPLLAKASHVDRFLRPALGDRHTERFVVLCLDSGYRLLHQAVVGQGSEDEVSVDPRAVFRQALTAQAPVVIVAHNHPSGDPRPSAQDKVLTAQLARAADALNIRLLDHVILGHPGYTSLREYGVPLSELRA